MMQDSDSREFRFSVITAVYNVESYVREAIESIVDQTIGFEEHIQLILVDDGSTDGSGSICAEYAERYPDNVVFLQKKNGGVSSARNLGLQHVRGQYVNFMDSDDKWGADAFRAVDEFFKNNEEAEIVSCRMMMFGSRAGDKHHLDYEYNATRLIDVDKVVHYPILSVSKSFISKDLVDGRSFDENVAIAEDMLFLNRIVIEKKKFGVIREAEYWCRSRGDSSSALDGARGRKDYYTVTPKRVYEELIKCSIDKYGEVIPYVQYLLITDLQWRLKRELPDGILTEDEKQDYLDTIRGVLSHIDDSIIMQQNHMGFWLKTQALKGKYGERFAKDPEVRRLLVDTAGLFASKLDSDGRTLSILGNANERRIDPGSVIYAEDDQGRRFDMTYTEYPAYDETALFSGGVSMGWLHSIELPVRAGAAYRFYMSGPDDEKKPLVLKLGTGSRLNKLEATYFAAGGFIFFKDECEIQIRKKTVFESLKADRQYNDMVKERTGGRSGEILELRKCACKLRRRSRIWLVGGASGMEHGLAERLYDLARSDRSLKVYYVADADPQESAGAGDKPGVVSCGSREHRQLLLAAEKFIMTAPDKMLTEPFGRDRKYYQDINTCERIFVPEKDVKPEDSSRLHMLRTGFDLVATDSPETGEVMRGTGFGYGEDRILTAGTAEELFELLKKRRN